MFTFETTIGIELPLKYSGVLSWKKNVNIDWLQYITDCFDTHPLNCTLPPSVLVDLWCWWEFDGARWVHGWGEDNRNVVAPPGGWRWCRRCVSDLHGSSGQAQSAYAGNGNPTMVVWRLAVPSCKGDAEIQELHQDPSILILMRYALRKISR